MDYKAYIAIFTAITVAYITYMNQLRLRAFELLLNVRLDTLKEVEIYIKRLYKIRQEFNGSNEQIETKKYMLECSYEGLILYHRLKGCKFGWPEEPFICTFYAIVNEPLNNDTVDIESWITRTLNALSALHSFAHKRINSELENLAYSTTTRLIKLVKYKLDSIKKINNKM